MGVYQTHFPLQLRLGLGGFWRVQEPKEGGDSLLSDPVASSHQGRPEPGIREGQGLETLAF